MKKFLLSMLFIAGFAFLANADICYESVYNARTGDYEAQYYSGQIEFNNGESYFAFNGYNTQDALWEANVTIQECCVQ